MTDEPMPAQEPETPKPKRTRRKKTDPLAEAAAATGLSPEEVAQAVERGNRQSKLADQPGVLVDELILVDEEPVQPAMILRPLEANAQGTMPERVLWAMRELPSRSPSSVKIGEKLGLRLQNGIVRQQFVSALNQLINRKLIVKVKDGHFSLPENAPKGRPELSPIGSGVGNKPSNLSRQARRLQERQSKKRPSERESAHTDNHGRRS